MTATAWSDLHPDGFPLLARIYVDQLGASDVVSPTGSAYIRAGMTGAGGFNDSGADGWGGGAAFAFGAETCAGGATFHVQRGDVAHTNNSANDALGDSFVKRAGGSVLAYADRGRPGGSKGLAANCTGSIKRNGVDSTSTGGGAAAGDDADNYPMGLGGAGATIDFAAFYGGGGGRSSALGLAYNFPAGDGRVCIEFYSRDPGLD